MLSRSSGRLALSGSRHFILIYMAFILGRKIEMNQIFKDDKVIPVTQIAAGPCYVVRVKTQEKEGYGAIQIGFGYKKKINKPLSGHLKPVGKNLRYLKEFIGDISKFKVGDEIKVDVFKPGDKLVVSGFSKGKGFAGVVKRHHFHGQPSTHGHKDQARMPGSIGSIRRHSGKVQKGKRMAGRMGGERVTVKNLEVMEINPEKNLLIIKGAVPGARNSLLEISSI